MDRSTRPLRWSAPGSTDDRESIPFAGITGAAKSPSARANAEYGSIGPQDDASGRRRDRLAFRDDHRGGARGSRAERGTGRCATKVRSPGMRLLDAGDARDLHVAVAFESAIEPLGDDSGRQRGAHRIGGFLIGSTGRAPSSAGVGLPACSQAPTMTPSGRGDRGGQLAFEDGLHPGEELFEVVVVVTVLARGRFRVGLQNRIDELIAGQEELERRVARVGDPWTASA